MRKLELTDYLNYKYQIENNHKKWCYDCINYIKDCFCGYEASNCKIFGSLDCDQDKFHPDVSADKCNEYKRSGKPLWVYKYINAYDALRLGLIEKNTNI